MPVFPGILTPSITATAWYSSAPFCSNPPFTGFLPWGTYPFDVGTNSINAGTNGRRSYRPSCAISLPPYATRHGSFCIFGTILHGCTESCMSAEPMNTGDLPSESVNGASRVLSMPGKAGGGEEGEEGEGEWGPRGMR